MDAACGCCGETNLEAMAIIAEPRRVPALLAVHHALGEANDENVVIPLGRNCHAKATAAQHDAAALPPGRAPTCLERLLLAMRSIATFFHQLADSFRRWADQIAGVVSSLDQHLPTWRGLPGMA